MNPAPESTSLAIHVACWILWTMAAGAVTLRFVARITKKHGISWDDYFMLLSLVLNFVAGVFASLAASYGDGDRLQEVIEHPENLSKALYWGNVANTIGLLGDSFPKIAVALLANRVLLPRRYLKIINVALPTILLALCVVVIIIIWVRCEPVAHGWDPHNVPGTCWDPKILNDLDLFVGSYGSFVDLYFVVYPSIVISRLQMHLRKKIITAIVMGLGVFSFFTTLYKTAAVVPGYLVAPGDITGEIGQLILWTLLEGNTVIIAGSIPTWGWLLRLDGLEKFVVWISLHSLRTSRNQGEQLGSQHEDMDQKNAEVGDKGEGQAEAADKRRVRAGKSELDSIAELERSVAR